MSNKKVAEGAHTMEERLEELSPRRLSPLGWLLSGRSPPAGWCPRATRGRVSLVRVREFRGGVLVIFFFYWDPFFIQLTSG
jgi:hypothetical protein